MITRDTRPVAIMTLILVWSGVMPKIANPPRFVLRVFVNSTVQTNVLLDKPGAWGTVFRLVANMMKIHAPSGPRSVSVNIMRHVPTVYAQ